jgi:membrane-associated phospholipid phosphatase
MSLPLQAAESQGYLARLASLIRVSLAQLVHAPAHPQRHTAARRMRRQLSWLLAIGAVVTVALMFGFDATEIAWMPPRGTPGLWPVRIVTDFGMDVYVLCGLASLLLVIGLALPLSRSARARYRLSRLGVDVEYLLLAVSVPVAVAEIIKWVVGRGRPFVGGHANAFNFAPFNGTEAHFSFPSAHAVTAFALAYGVAAIWPRTRVAMAAYAVLIGLTRLVLLAHHPSDVVAGAVIGVAGAIAVRHWFAARRLGFVIGPNGEIAPR